MRGNFKRRRLFLLSLMSELLVIVSGLSCHECGHMYDGATFMGIQNFAECQFFEHDISENANKFLKECPNPDEKCCFSLREHMSIEFWGHAAAAEVFVHGCCSSLNATSHHLESSVPPPLVTAGVYRAEIMSQTIQNGDIKTRVLFCNTLGCNNQRVPWSEPIMVLDRSRSGNQQVQPERPQGEQNQPQADAEPTMRRGPSLSVRNGRRDDTNTNTDNINNNNETTQQVDKNKMADEDSSSTIGQARGFIEEDNLLALLDQQQQQQQQRGRVRQRVENVRRGLGRPVVDAANVLADPDEELDSKEEIERRAKEQLLRDLAVRMGLADSIVTTTATTTTTTTTTTTAIQILGNPILNRSRIKPPSRTTSRPTVCECQCSCPTLVCPTLTMPVLRSSSYSLLPSAAIIMLNLAISLI